MVEKDRPAGLDLTDKTRRALELLGNGRPLSERVRYLTSVPADTLRVWLGSQGKRNPVGPTNSGPFPPAA